MCLFWAGKLPKQDGMNRIKMTFTHITGKSTKNKRLFRSGVYESEYHVGVAKERPKKGMLKVNFVFDRLDQGRRNFFALNTTFDKLSK